MIVDAQPFKNDSLKDDDSNYGKEIAILCKTRRFFENEENYSCIESILSEEPSGQTVSLRVLDFLVTNYAKKFGVAYTHRGELVSLFAAYKSALRAYSKRSFDAFCRRDRILFRVGDRVPLLTTHAQLNFLQWAIDLGVYKYALRHRATIENEMANLTRQRKLHRKNTALTSCDDPPSPPAE